jgi:hypothetical protein
MMSCKEAARSISEERDHQLSLGQRMGLRMHLVMCALCRGYKQNIEALGRIFARAGDAVLSSLPLGDSDNKELSLSVSAKQRIKDKIDETDSSE